MGLSLTATQQLAAAIPLRNRERHDPRPPARLPGSPPLVAARAGGGAWMQRSAGAALGYAVPESVGEWLEVLATTHIRHPPPTDWRGLQTDVAKLQDRRPLP